jgi:hypothetical protein
MLGPHTHGMTRIYRPAEPPTPPSPPVWRQWKGLLTVEVARALLTSGRLLRSRALRYLLGLVGLVVQLVLVVLTWELVQVCASVAEMWVALARKYLEVAG